VFTDRSQTKIVESLGTLSEGEGADYDGGRKESDGTVEERSFGQRSEKRGIVPYEESGRKKVKEKS